MLCLCLRVCAHARVSDLLKHKGKLHAVFGNILCVQKTVELEVDPPAGAVLVGAGRQSEGERSDSQRVAKGHKTRVPHGTHTTVLLTSRTWRAHLRPRRDSQWLSANRRCVRTRQTCSCCPPWPDLGSASPPPDKHTHTHACVSWTLSSDSTYPSG